MDPHQHLIGGSGECCGYSSLTPAITFAELAMAGITTVVGTLGTDTTTRGMASLLAKVKGLNDEGLTAYLYTGGYRVPPTTLFSSVREDIMLISEIIGTGELAISDHRSSQPTLEELARVVSDSYVGGMLSYKAGVTHFHLGPGKNGLNLLTELLDSTYEVHPESLYPTHINRTSETVRQAAELSNRGCFVDMDTVDEDLSDWLPQFLDQGGDLNQLSVSSDAGSASPANLYSEFRRWCGADRAKFIRFLPIVTANAARALKLNRKGHIRVGGDADFLFIDPGTFEIRHVMAKGKWILKDGKPSRPDAFSSVSNRVQTFTSIHKPSLAGRDL